MKRILVTGGAGFIGSHLCAALLARGYAVRVLDDLSLGQRAWVPEPCEFQQGDIADMDTCRRAVEGVEAFWSVLMGSEALRTRRLQQERELEEALAEELGDPLVAALIAATLRAVYTAAISDRLAGASAEEVAARQPAVIDRAFDMLERGLPTRRG